MIRKTYILLLMLLLGFSMSLINSFADEVIEGTPEFQKVPNLIFGTPDFEKMRDLDPDSQDYQLGTKVGWLYVPQTPNSGRRTCTGFLVGPDLFMTNRHCIYSGGSLLPIVGARIYMDYYQEVSVDQTRGGVTARVTEVLRMDASKDYALLRLDTPIGNTYGWLELDTTTQVNSSQSVKLISHPEERSKEIVRRNSQIFDIPDWHPIYGVPFLFAYLADTVGGSSGCPVFLRDGTGVIGINHSQWERGRPKVPHFNAGTLMSHIVPEIRQWLPSGPYLPKVPDKAYTKGTAIEPYTLPPASETFAVGAVTYTLTGLPAGLAFDPTSRILTGTPNPTTTGVTTATYTATDTASNADNVSFTITVNPVVSLVAPANFPAAGTSYLRGQPFADMTVPNATGGTGDPANYTYAVTGLPTGLTFNATGKEITGTPTAAGVSTVTITATDTVRATGSADFTITVTAAPALVFRDVVAPQTYEVGTPITQVSLPEGSGGIPPYTYALAPIPDGLSFSPTTRVLSGTPTTAQAAKDHTYTISDSAFSHVTSPSAGQGPNTRTLPINITVTAAPPTNRPPDFGNATVENIVATVGTAISQRTLPTATDPDGDTLTYSISPALPTGLSFNASTRILSGTPSAAKPQTAYTYQVSDGKGGEDTIGFSMIVKAAPPTNRPPDFGNATVENIVATVGTAISQRTLPTATDPDGDTLTYSISPALPTGLNFNATNRTLTGTPTAIMVETAYTYQVEDGKGGADTIGFFITINALDVNGDGQVTVIDLVMVALFYGTRVPTGISLPADVNADSVVDILDLVAVAQGVDAASGTQGLWQQEIEAALLAAAEQAAEIETIAEAPNASSHGNLTYRNVAAALTDAKQLATRDGHLEKGVPVVLEELLQLLTEMKAIPETSALLPNYPNPFNPETWLPYQLATPAAVTLSIYSVDGQLVRTLKIGHQPAGVYRSKHRAAYWDGKNRHGEPVASGVYFYTLTAGDFTATRKLSIAK